jgi:hypothetical protein
MILENADNDLPVQGSRYRVFGFKQILLSNTLPGAPFSSQDEVPTRASYTASEKVWALPNLFTRVYTRFEVVWSPKPLRCRYICIGKREGCDKDQVHLKTIHPGVSFLNRKAEVGNIIVPGFTFPLLRH